MAQAVAQTIYFYVWYRRLYGVEHQGCADPTRLVAVGAVGLLVLMFVCHSLSARIPPYKAQFSGVGQLRWSLSCANALTGLLRCVHGYRFYTDGAFDGPPSFAAARTLELESELAYATGNAAMSVGLGLILTLAGARFPAIEIEENALLSLSCCAALMVGSGHIVPTMVMMLGFGMVFRAARFHVVELIKTPAVSLTGWVTDLLGFVGCVGRLLVLARMIGVVTGHAAAFSELTAAARIMSTVGLVWLLSLGYRWALELGTILDRIGTDVTSGGFFGRKPGKENPNEPKKAWDLS